VSFSGLDGAGKTAQARALRNALESLGVEAVVEWAPAHQVNLRFLANPIRSLLKMDARSTAPGHSNPDLRPTRHPALVTHAWVTIQAVAIAWSLWRSALSHVGRGRVVIFDRQALDFAVFVLYRHGASHRLGPELRLLRAFAPRPALAFLLDVAGDTARDRKPEQFTVEELRMQARLYRRERSLFAVELLDGEADVEELCSYVAERVWRRLRKAGR
jgi:thymidylate kinase